MLSREQIREYQDDFLDLADKFSTRLNKVILPIRLGIFTLYSIKKLSIFNKSIIDILDHYLRDEDFNHHGERYRSGKSDQDKIDFAKFVFDALAKDSKLGNRLFDQEELLLQLFEHYNSDKNTLFKQMFKIRQELLKDGDSNIMLEHRFEQTPTLLLVLPLQQEQTNYVLRKHKRLMDYFARIVFVSEQEDKDYYQNEITALLLDSQVKNRLKNGVSIGNCTFKYLAYSNSQIKNHSFWMICEDGISFKEIIDGLG